MRLCNPCVPDPNTAPPQATSAEILRRPGQHQSHNRSTSLATPYYTTSQSESSTPNPDRLAAALLNYPRRTREPSILGRAPPVTTSSSYTQSSSSLGHDLSSATSGLSGSRSRSSTVGLNSSLASQCKTILGDGLLKGNRVAATLMARNAMSGP